MKNLVFILVFALAMESYAQVNCPIFPKAKKKDSHFFSNTYTTFGANLGYYKGEMDINGKTIHPAGTAHLGISQCFKRRFVSHTLLSFAHGANISDSEGLGIGFLLGADYFFKQSFSGFGIGASLSSYGQGAQQTFHFIYATKNQKNFNAYYLGSGFWNKNYFLTVGIKIGVLVFK